jgi:hypothetical protein
VAATEAAAVTVLMPVRAPHPDYFAAAMVSVREQSSPRWRLLLIAERRERSRIAAVVDPDDRISVIGNEGRRLAGAINSGMRHATTEFVSLLFSDDLLEPNAIAVLEREIGAHPDVDFFHTGRRVVDDVGVQLGPVFPPREVSGSADFVLDAPVKHLLCWRRSMGIAVGGLDERSRSVGPDDLDFTWTMAEHGARFQAVHECLYVYRDHRSGRRLTIDLPLSVHLSELERIFTKHGLPEAVARRRLEQARRTYLQQCAYDSRRDRAVRRLLRRPPRVWRDTYR